MLEDDEELLIIKNLFFQIDWKIAGMGISIGKDFNQIIWYCKESGLKNWKKYVKIIHSMGKVWAANENKGHDGKNSETRNTN